MNLLLIDTSSPGCRVGRVAEGRLVDERQLEGENRHSEGLNPLISELMGRKEAYATLKGVVVINGPGSYTGLRIGAAFAKALVLVTGCRLLAVNGLDVLARQYQLDGYEVREGDYLIPMVDARRMEVFTQTIRLSANPVLVHPPGARILTAECYRECAGGRLHFMGDGCAKFQEILEPTRRNEAEFVAVVNHRMDAMAELAVQQFEQERFVTDDYWQPDYHKEFYYPAPQQKSASSLAGLPDTI